MRLALAVANQEQALEIPIAEPEQTTRMRLKLIPARRLALGFDTVEATGVACYTDADMPSRTVWIGPGPAYLPVLMEGATPEGQARMTLESWCEIPTASP